MISIWAVIAIALCVGLYWMARPFLARNQLEMTEGETSISIYRDQLDELSRDLKNGLIDKEEYESAKEEIEARTLLAARNLGAGMSVSQRSPVKAGIVVVSCGVLALGAYQWLGSPAAPDRPLAERRMETLERQAAAGDLTSRIELLIENTKKDPESFDDWWMLARSYSATGDHASAADAYRHAVELSDNRPTVLSSYAEALTLANGNKVPKAARVIFEQVAQDSPDPRARYYIALSKAQAQDFKGALNDWSALYRNSEPDAPWTPLVRRDIVNMVRFLKRDVRIYLPDATPAEIAKAKGEPGDTTAMERRVAELKNAIEADTGDYKTWIELAGIQAQLGQTSEAVKTIADARKRYKGAPFLLGKLDQAAAEYGLDLVRNEDNGVSGPTSEDVAAAAQMTEEERAQMSAGMIDGLAAKLEEQPDNPDGWIMLVRSYQVSGKPEKARAAYERAVAYYKGNDTVLARLKSDAETILQSR